MTKAKADEIFARAARAKLNYHLKSPLNFADSNRLNENEFHQKETEKYQNSKFLVKKVND